MYPRGYAIYKAANIPRTLLPAAIAFGSFGLTMTSIPGTPQIQNLIPMDYFGTSASAAPVMGIVAAIIVLVPGYIYLNRRVKKAREAKLGFIEDPTILKETETQAGEAAVRYWLSGLVPLIVVFITLNLLKWNIVVSLITGIIVCCLFHPDKLKRIPQTITEGAKGSVTAIMNTACAVGFGSVIRIVPGFALLTALLISQNATPMSLLFSEAISTSVLSGATGSASGGLSIALAAFADQYMAVAQTLGISPDILHRVASIAAGSLDKLPHNGAVITLLAVSHCTHKDSYKDIFVVSVIIPMIALVVLLLIWGLIL
jgi:H+/gluconate symporter-like permease